MKKKIEEIVKKHDMATYTRQSLVTEIIEIRKRKKNQSAYDDLKYNNIQIDIMYKINFPTNEIMYWVEKNDETVYTCFDYERAVVKFDELIELTKKEIKK